MEGPEKVLGPEEIEWHEEPEIEEAIDKAEHGIVPQGHEEGRPSTEHENVDWRAARLSKP